MKNIIITIAFAFSTILLVAQSPEKLSYQAVIRDNNNQLVENQSVGLRISVLKNSANGTIIYREIQTRSTNANGLVTLEIGGGTAETGIFSDINWGSGTYFLKTEIDPEGGSNYKITGSSQLISVPYALHAKNAQSLSNLAGIATQNALNDTAFAIRSNMPKSTTYSVGDFAHGGIVFWVDETGQHGLVCAKVDQSSGVRWHAGTDGATRARGDGPFSGKANTAIIIAAHVAIGDDGDDYAARICNELLVTEGGKTYGDWYLPSREELNLMYKNKSIINSAALSNEGSALMDENYWSSFENGVYGAWDQNFINGNQYKNGDKDNLHRVRAIRTF